MALTIDDSYFVTGFVHDNKVIVENVTTVPYGGRGCSDKGPYIFSVFDMDGNEIYICPFSSNVPACENSEGCPTRDVQISVVIPAYANQKYYSVKNVGSGEESQRYEISGEKPSITFTSVPSVGSSGEVSLSWSAQDIDSTDLAYSIFYSAEDGKSGTWMHLRDLKNSDSAVVDVPFGYGSITQSRFRVIVGDGINAADAISDATHVDARYRPPQLYVRESAEDDNIIKGTMYRFLVDFITPEYEKTPPDNITWSSNKDGVFGHGKSLNYAGLSVGTHTITVTVNTPGGTAEKTFGNIIVAEKKPEIVLTVGDGTQPDLACNELKIDVMPGDAALEEVTWNSVGGDMVAVPVDQLPIRRVLKDPSSFVLVNVTTKVPDLGNRKEAYIKLNTCPPPVPSTGG